MLVKLSHFYSKDRMITPRKARCVICNSPALSSIFLDSFHYQRSGTDVFYCGCGERRTSERAVQAHSNLLKDLKKHMEKRRIDQEVQTWEIKNKQKIPAGYLPSEICRTLGETKETGNFNTHTLSTEIIDGQRNQKWRMVDNAKEENSKKLYYLLNFTNV